MTKFNINAFQRTHRDPKDPRFMFGVFCMDGFRMSVQASRIHYCSLREDDLPRYDSYEVGFPSLREQSLMQYAEEPNNPTETVYAYVPAGIINEIVDHHGGLDMTKYEGEQQ